MIASLLYTTVYLRYGNDSFAGNDPQSEMKSHGLQNNSMELGCTDDGTPAWRHMVSGRPRCNPMELGCTKDRTPASTTRPDVSLVVASPGVFSNRVVLGGASQKLDHPSPRRRELIDRNTDTGTANGFTPLASPVTRRVCLLQSKAW